MHYDRGDKSVFLRKILGMRSKSKLARITKHYRSNGDFREYVNRYLKQFDELIANSKQSDPDGALGSALMTSDAGKVYLVLRAAVERDESNEPPAAP